MRGIIGNEAHYHPGRLVRWRERLSEKKEKLQESDSSGSRLDHRGAAWNIVMHALPVWQTGHDY